MRWHEKKASTAFAKGQLVELAANRLEPADSSTVRVYGVNQDNEVSASDTGTDRIGVLVPKGLGTVEMAVSGTLGDAQVGGQYDLVDSQTIDTSATTNKTVRILRILDSGNKVVEAAINPFISA